MATVINSKGFTFDPSALAWRKSSFSEYTNCVELAPLEGGGVAIRDSEHPEVAPLVFTRNQARAFLAASRAGEFDHLVS